MPLEKSSALRRAKSGAGRRAMQNREAKILENPKSLLVLKGHRTSGLINDVLADLHMLNKPDCRKLQRKNDLLPFEAGGETHLENLCRLNDCSLFAVGNHTKKRPHNLILGRTFGFRILDMFEFGITHYEPFSKPLSSAPGSAPLMLFNGDDFEATETTRSMKSLLLDMFRGPSDIKRLYLGGIDKLVVFSLVGESKVLFRQYKVVLRKAAGSTLPRPELEEIGPSFDMEVRRTHLAPAPMMKTAMKQARDPRLDWKTKNVSKDVMGDKKGQIHVGTQDLSNLTLARIKGLNKKRGKPTADEGGEDVDEDEEDVSAKKARVTAE